MQQGIEICTRAEYDYYREERCGIDDLYEKNVYIAMFALKSMQHAIKLPAVIHRVIKNASNSNLITVELEEKAKPLPLLIQNDGITPLAQNKRLNVRPLQFQDQDLSEGYFRSVNEYDEIEINIARATEEKSSSQNMQCELIAC